LIALPYEITLHYTTQNKTMSRTIPIATYRPNFRFHTYMRRALMVTNKQYLSHLSPWWLQTNNTCAYSGCKGTKTFYWVNLVVWSKANLNKLCKKLTSTIFEGIIITNFSTCFRASPPVLRMWLQPVKFIAKKSKCAGIRKFVFLHHIRAACRGW
jgi:hypothetical protein